MGVINITRSHRRIQPGVPYHVISRVNNQEFLLENHHCKDKYLTLLKQAKQRYDFNLFAYCIMDNHVHLIMRMNANSLSSVIQWLNQKFAFDVNKRMGRNGHLFGDRFKAYPILGDEKVRETIKYIHRNPLAANMVETLIYPWSSHHIYIGRPEKAWFEASEGLELFKDGTSNAKNNYLNFVNKMGDVERLVAQKILSERDVNRIEDIQLPGDHEYILSRPQCEARANIQGQLDLVFGRLCLMNKLDYPTIRDQVRDNITKKTTFQRFKRVGLALSKISQELQIATSDEVNAYLKLPPDFLNSETAKDAIKIDFEVQGLIEVYRQTFPQRTES
jgi:REP element-mobilizing transposase RayT